MLKKTQTPLKRNLVYLVNVLLLALREDSPSVLRARLLQCMNQGVPDVQAVFRRGRGIRDQIANICWIRENTREFQKTPTSTLITLKPLTRQITTNCGKFLKR